MLESDPWKGVAATDGSSGVLDFVESSTSFCSPLHEMKAARTTAEEMRVQEEEE